MTHVVIIGAGQAGASCAARLRSNGHMGDITIIGAESAPPYQRPPLSKAYLLGEMELKRLFLRPNSYYAEQNITLRLDERAMRIDPVSQQVHLADDTLAYSDLVIATGARPRRLPATMGGDLQGVYYVRDLADADAMAPQFRSGARVLIVGGGYIGLEAAAVAAKKGLSVTLIEMADRILQRVAAPQTSDFFRQLHQAHGVDIREGVGLESLTGARSISGAQLSDGSDLEVDFAIVGAGVSPRTELAENAGITIDNGICADAFGRTSAAHVWAAGDCASFPHGGTRIRLESVPGAIDMAESVADNIMGAEREYIAKPWFWSDQFNVKLQIAGLNSGYDRVIERISDQSARSFWYFRGDQLLAVDAANDPRGYMVGKRLIEMGKSPDPSVIADASADLKALLRG